MHMNTTTITTYATITIIEWKYPSLNMSIAKAKVMVVDNTGKPLSNYTAITRSWLGYVRFLIAPWDRRKMQKIVANHF